VGVVTGLVTEAMAGTVAGVLIGVVTGVSAGIGAGAVAAGGVLYRESWLPARRVRWQPRPSLGIIGVILVAGVWAGIVTWVVVSGLRELVVRSAGRSDRHQLSCEPSGRACMGSQSRNCRRSRDRGRGRGRGWGCGQGRGPGRGRGRGR
jgi:hypothetical protein